MLFAFFSKETGTQTCWFLVLFRLFRLRFQMSNGLSERAHARSKCGSPAPFWLSSSLPDLEKTSGADAMVFRRVSYFSCQRLADRNWLACLQWRSELLLCDTGAVQALKPSDVTLHWCFGNPHAVPRYAGIAIAARLFGSTVHRSCSNFLPSSLCCCLCMTTKLVIVVPDAVVLSDAALAFENFKSSLQACFARLSA